MAFELKAYLSERQALVNDFLLTYFKRHKETGKLYESVVYSLEAGGKRIRPVLAMAAFEAVQGSESDLKPVLPFAAALECIHTYSLIHDDLPAMDDDDLRRGKPTNHKVFGEATAILAGDALLTEAFSLCSYVELELAAEQKLTAIRRLADGAGAAGMVGGQLYDMEHEGQKPTLESLQRIHTNKTGRLLTAAVELGAIAAGVKESDLKPFTDFGYHLGYGFQIYDDVLDVVGGAEIGKSQKSDIERDKATFVALLGVDESKKRAEQEIQTAIQSIEHLGDRATALIEIAKYIVYRDR